MQLIIGDEAIERVVLAHGEHKRAGKVDAHLPVHHFFTAAFGEVCEPGMGNACKVYCPAEIVRVAGDPAHP